MASKDPLEIGQEIRDKIKNQYQSQSAFCKGYNLRQCDIKDHIDEPTITRIIKGRYKTITKKITNVCNFLAINTKANNTLDVNGDIIELIKSVSKKDEEHLMGIIREVVKISSRQG